jgi:hypothetical protein
MRILQIVALIVFLALAILGMMEEFSTPTLGVRMMEFFDNMK